MVQLHIVPEPTIKKIKTWQKTYLKKSLSLAQSCLKTVRTILIEKHVHCAFHSLLGIQLSEGKSGISCKYTEEQLIIHC